MERAGRKDIELQDIHLDRGGRLPLADLPKAAGDTRQIEDDCAVDAQLLLLDRHIAHDQRSNPAIVLRSLLERATRSQADVEPVQPRVAAVDDPHQVAEREGDAVGTRQRNQLDSTELMRPFLTGHGTYPTQLSEQLSR